MANPIKILKNGIINENPTFVQVIGMCPTLAVTSSAINGIGMGLSTTAVLIFANLFVSLLRKVIPDKVRIPCFICIRWYRYGSWFHNRSGCSGSGS